MGYVIGQTLGFGRLLLNFPFFARLAKLWNYTNFYSSSGITEKYHNTIVPEFGSIMLILVASVVMIMISTRKFRILYSKKL